MRYLVFSMLVVSFGCATVSEQQLRDLCRDVKAKNDAGMTCLHLAVQEDGQDIRYLIQRGADVNAKGYRQRTPLHFAISMCRIENARILLEHGADVNAQNYQGDTPLHESAFLLCVGKTDRESLQRQAIELLAAHGADINLRNENGQTVLHNYSMYRSAGIIRLLLEKGALPTLADRGGRTALHFAAMNGNYPILPFLVDKGADVNARSEKGETPLSLARTWREKHTGIVMRERYDKTIDFLEKHGAR